MADVATEYAKVDNVNFKTRVPSAPNKSPSLINIRTTKMSGGSVTDGAVLGTTANYVNVGFANGNEKGYLDFGKDPYLDQRQTRMHLINAKLHSDANTHNGPNQGVHNLFWGSMKANQKHKTSAEKPNQVALEQIQNNTDSTKSTPLFYSLEQINPLVKESGSDVTIKHHGALHHCTFNNTTNENTISRNDWKKYSAFALDYTTTADYHSNTTLRGNFMAYLPEAIAATNLAKLNLNDRKNALNAGLGRTDINLPTIGVANPLNQMLTTLPTKALNLVNVLVDDFIIPDFEGVLGAFDATAMGPVLNYIPTHIPTLSTALFGVNTSTISDILTKPIKEIATELNLNATIKNEVKDFLNKQTSDYLSEKLLARKPNTIKALADYIADYTDNPNNTTVRNNLKDYNYLHIDFVLAESDDDYQQKATTAANELQNLSVEGFKSFGKVFLPKPDATNWTDFKKLDTETTTNFLNKQLDSMNTYYDYSPHPRFGKKEFNYS